MSIRDYLSSNNPDKMILARLSSGKSIVKVLDRADGNKVILRYAIALTNANGDIMTGSGIVLTGEELKELGATIVQCAEAGKIRASAPRAQWEAEKPQQQKKEPRHIW